LPHQEAVFPRILQEKCGLGVDGFPKFEVLSAGVT